MSLRAALLSLIVGLAAIPTFAVAEEDSILVVQNAIENDVTAFIGRNQPGGVACWASPSGAFLE